MILLCGIPSESPMRLVRARLETSAAPFVLFNQREFADASIEYEIDGGQVTGELKVRGHAYRLEEFKSVYTRLMDDRFLPELDGQPPDSPLRRHCRGFHDALMKWMEVAPALVVNRCGPMSTNGSKPYQTQLIRDQGFRVPETLITNEPDLVREFCARHGRVIYKSISSARSIVQSVGPADFERLESIRWCPTQFQAYVEGTDLRVHTTGGDVYATAIATGATDYRYAARQTGENAELREAELSDELAQRCLRLAKALNLGFAGIDLKVTPDGEVYCFEVNPCPAFSFYECNTGQPISEGVARCLRAA